MLSRKLELLQAESWCNTGLHSRIVQWTHGILVSSDNVTRKPTYPTLRERLLIWSWTGQQYFRPVVMVCRGWGAACDVLWWRGDQGAGWWPAVRGVTNYWLWYSPASHPRPLLKMTLEAETMLAAVTWTSSQWWLRRLANQRRTQTLNLRLWQNLYLKNQFLHCSNLDLLLVSIFATDGYFDVFSDFWAVAQFSGPDISQNGQTECTIAGMWQVCEAEKLKQKSWNASD